MKDIPIGGPPCDPNVDAAAAVGGGGMEDACGEDRAAEEQLVTPWTLTVARFVSNRVFFFCDGALCFGGPEFRPAQRERPSVPIRRFCVLSVEKKMNNHQEGTRR